MNLLMKKSVIEEAGGFDERLPSQYDTDLGFRITSRGYKIVFEPKRQMLPLQQELQCELISGSNCSTAKTPLNSTLNIPSWLEETK